MKIAVYGATGFVGRLVSAELRRRDLTPVLVGRDKDRLHAAASASGGTMPDIRVAALDDPAALAAALHGIDAVINCASPFTSLGEPVIRAAVTAGAHYVDVSGEELYIKGVLERHAEAAKRVGVTVVPAANNDCLTGDLLGHLAAEGLGEIETLSVAFRATDAEASRGTVLMALTTKDTMRNGGLAWSQGTYRTEARPRRTTVLWPGAEEEVPVVRFAMPPAITIPRHVPTLHSEGLASPEIHALFAGATQEMADSMPVRQGPGPASRARARFTLVIDVTAVDGRRRRAVLQAPDMYGTTAVIAVEAARRLVADPVPSGALAPAEVFDARDFLDYLVPHGLTWHVSSAEK
ncbi:saccharopine dehydrogenase family protein [Streptomyces sp. NPDC051636]|uniref:saccharopine dehydrogenase family protein n=1 Tax=Streptomyces sp. NPDC051636 TaxID=3365663 RepID=UPI0037AC9DC9